MAELLNQLRQLDRHELVVLIREAAARLEALDNDGISPELEAELNRVRDAYALDGNPGEDWKTVRERIVLRMKTA